MRPFLPFRHGYEGDWGLLRRRVASRRLLLLLNIAWGVGQRPPVVCRRLMLAGLREIGGGGVLQTTHQGKGPLPGTTHQVVALRQQFRSE